MLSNQGLQVFDGPLVSLVRGRPDFQKLLGELEAKANDKETKPAQPEK